MVFGTGCTEHTPQDSAAPATSLSPTVVYAPLTAPAGTAGSEPVASRMPLTAPATSSTPTPIPRQTRPPLSGDDLDFLAALNMSEGKILPLALSMHRAVSLYDWNYASSLASSMNTSVKGEYTKFERYSVSPVLEYARQKYLGALLNYRDSADAYTMARDAIRDKDVSLAEARIFIGNDYYNSADQKIRDLHQYIENIH